MKNDKNIEELRLLLKYKNDYLYGFFVWKNITNDEESRRIENLTWEEIEIEAENELKMLKEKYNVK